MRLSERIQRVAPSPTLAITARAKAMKAKGIDIISFGAGEPDFDTPEAICEAAKQAIDEGKTRYTPASGLAELRAAVAADYARRGRQVAAEEVLITVGGKQALFNATQVLFQPGDKVLVPAPYWVSYPAQLHLAGATSVILKTEASDDYRLDPARLREALDQGGIQGLILCSPSNPTGTTYTEEELRALAEVLAEFEDVVVLYDAMYDRLYYEGAVAPDLVAAAPQLQKRVLTFNGFSKTFAMTGWRLGYAIGPAQVIQAMGTLQSQSTSNATSFVQYAALEALTLDDSILLQRRQAFQKRRDAIVSGLRAIDAVNCLLPKGAFYAFPDFSSYIDPAKSEAEGYFADDLRLTEFLLTEARVAVVPGSAFGAPGSLRLSYALSDELIAEGLQRMKQALEAFRA